jgi:hypothetical protein
MHHYVIYFDLWENMPATNIPLNIWTADRGLVKCIHDMQKYFPKWQTEIYSWPEFDLLQQLHTTCPSESRYNTWERRPAHNTCHKGNETQQSKH